MWRVELTRSARSEYAALSDVIRHEALILPLELAEDPFLEDALPMRGHRNHYRLRFYRDQYRIIYRVSNSQREVVVTRIRRRDRATYSGYEVT